MGSRLRARRDGPLAKYRARLALLNSSPRSQALSLVAPGFRSEELLSGRWSAQNRALHPGLPLPFSPPSGALGLDSENYRARSERDSLHLRSAYI